VPDSGGRGEWDLRPHRAAIESGSKASGDHLVGVVVGFSAGGAHEASFYLVFKVSPTKPPQGDAKADDAKTTGPKAEEKKVVAKQVDETKKVKALDDKPKMLAKNEPLKKG
jgi:hypothetical protein